MGGVDFRNRATGWGYGLVGCYFVAFVVTVVQIALIAVRGARIKSFHGAFLVLTSLWLPLRVLVLVLTPEDGDDDSGIDTIEVLYYLPTVLQVRQKSGERVLIGSARPYVGLVRGAPPLCNWASAVCFLLPVGPVPALCVTPSARAANLVAHDRVVRGPQWCPVSGQRGGNRCGSGISARWCACQ